MNEKSGIAIYGSVGLKRVYCDYCKRMAFVIDGRKQCCDRKESTAIESCYKMSDSYSKRKHYSPAVVKKIIEKQNNLCLYCGNEFGYLYFRDNKIIKSTIHIDHLSPFSFSLDNGMGNLRASCNLCNLFKTDKIFDSIGEVKEYVIKKREQKGIEVLS